MKKIVNNRANDDNRMGFTLIELLAVIAILSLVVSISMAVVTNVVQNAKNISYEVTISNIEKNGGTYVLENQNDFSWISTSIDTNSNKEFVCITVQDLIDKGYFKGI